MDDPRTARMLRVYEEMRGEQLDYTKIADDAMDKRWHTVAFSDRPQHVKIRANWRPSLLWGNMTPQEVATSTDPDIIRRRRYNNP